MKPIELALKSMAYVEQKPGIWLKPVGYHCYAFRVDIFQFFNYFIAGTKELVVYNREEVPEEYRKNVDQLLQWIKYTEAYSRHDVSVSSSSQFHLTVYDL